MHFQHHVHVGLHLSSTAKLFLLILESLGAFAHPYKSTINLKGPLIKRYYEKSGLDKTNF